MTTVETWVETHADWVVLAIIAIGFVLRVQNASFAYLHADEALHFLVSLQTSLSEILRIGSYQAHPPLLYGVLWLWRRVGDSELTLRLPLALAGSGFVWFVYRWAALAIDKRTALLAAGLLSFSPSIICTVTEVRQYALMLLFTSAALYALEVAFARRSARWIAIYFACFTLAILSHYSVAWFAVAVGAYALARIVRGDLPRGLVRAWFATQVAAGCCYLVLYRFYMSGLNDGPLRQLAIVGYLRHFYMHGDASRWRFFANGTDAVFGYQLASSAAGHIGLALFCLGVAWLLSDRRWPVALLLVAAFVAAFAGCVLQLTPYGGSRHASFLAPFVAVGVSAGLAGVLSRLAGRRMLPVVALLTIVALGWPHIADPHAYDVLRPYRRKQGWWDAAAYVRTTIPPGSILFADAQTSLQLGYYLGRDRVWQQIPRQDSLREYAYGAYRVIASPDWRLRPGQLRPQLLRVQKALGLSASAPIWIVIAGRSSAMYSMLAARHPILRTVSHARFGGSVAVFQAPPTEEAW